MAGPWLGRFEPLEPRQMLDGEGLTGRYYDAAEFTSLKATRVDATVDFDWGTGSPATGVAATTYSVRWTGAVVPEFSEMVTFTVTADDGVRLWVDDELIINHWVNQDAKGVSGQIALRAGVATPLTLEYFQGTGTASVRLEWSSRSMPRQVIPQARLNATVTPDNRGTALQETWTGVAGGTVADLTGSTAYAGPPAYRQMITSLQSLQQDVGDSNGSRVRGFIVPPATGSYVFSVAGNDDVRLSLGTDANPATATRIAFTSAVTAPLEWTKTSTQTSAAISLVQGRRYFFEVLHKENAGFNHWAVGWTTPLSSAVAVIASIWRAGPVMSNTISGASSGWLVVSAGRITVGSVAIAPASSAGSTYQVRPTRNAGRAPLAIMRRTVIALFPRLIATSLTVRYVVSMPPETPRAWLVLQRWCASSNISCS